MTSNTTSTWQQEAILSTDVHIAFACNDLELDPLKLEDSVDMPYNERMNRLNAIADSLVEFEWIDVLQNTLQIK